MARKLQDAIARQAPIRVGPDFLSEFPAAREVGVEVVLNTIRAAGLLLREVEEMVREQGLTVAAFNLLEVLSRSGEPLQPAVLSQRLLVPGQTLTSVLDSLERRGLVERTGHPLDRRAVLVSITPAGNDCLHAACGPVVEGEMRWSSVLTEDEQHTLVELLGRLQRRVLDD